MVIVQRSFFFDPAPPKPRAGRRVYWRKREVLMTARARSTAMAMVCLLCGCAGGGSAPVTKTAQHPQAGSRPASPRAEARREAAPVEEQLRASIDPDEVEGQVRALRQAIALYGQFIERAGNQPEMKDAVERSKERIEDAQATIDFLLQKGEPERD
jgi:hypothetical protein